MPSVRSQRLRRAPNRPKRRKIRWTRLVLLLVIVVAIITSIGWAAVQVFKKISDAQVVSTVVDLVKPKETVAKVVETKPPEPISKPVEIPKKPEPVSKYINILLLGIDDGDSENTGSPQRSDAMMIASIDSETGKVNLLSIPRDTKVAIPGHKGFEKITHAFYYGGSELAIRTVEDLLQLHINHTIVINWQAFIKTVDLLGGVDLYVENNMHYEDPYANLVIQLTQGYQHLDGSQAGQYVRFRSDELGDIGRVQRQQRFLKAMTEQSLQFSTIFKLPKFINNLDQYVTTDISGFKMLKLANNLKSFRSGSLSAEMLPGKFATVNGISYWVHDEEQTQQLIEQMLINDKPK